MRDMKGQLILFNATSVIVCLFWLGWKLLEGYAKAFGSTSGSGPNVEYVMVIVGVATAVCVPVSFFVPPGAAKFVALAPLALIVLGHGAMSYLKDAYYDRRAREMPARSSAEEELVDENPRDYFWGIGRDYRIRDETPVGSKMSFLTHDRTLQTILRIEVGSQKQIEAFPIGRINGETLETLERPEELEKLYKRYVNRDGESIFDRYKLTHRPDQDKNYHLEKYKR